MFTILVAEVAMVVNTVGRFPTSMASGSLFGTTLFE